MQTILFSVSPYDPVSQTNVTIRMTMAAVGAISGVTVNNLAWTPCITTSPTWEIAVFDDGLVGETATIYTDIEFQINALFSNAAWLGYRFGGCTAQMWYGTLGQPWASFTKCFEGTVGDLRIDEGQAKLQLLGPDRVLTEKLCDTLYTGTGGLNGTTDLTDKPRPRCYGPCQNIEPVQIDTTFEVYQVHDGPVNAITAVYEKAMVFNAAVTDYATYAALTGATLAEGTWATCNALGLFRLASKPTGVITCDVQGAKFQSLTGNFQSDPSFEAGVPSKIDRPDGGGVILTSITNSPFNGTKALGVGALGGHHWGFQNTFVATSSTMTISVYARDAGVTNTSRTAGWSGGGPTTVCAPFFIGFYNQTANLWMDAVTYVPTGAMVKQQVVKGNTSWVRFSQTHTGLTVGHTYAAQMMVDPYNGEQAIDIDALQVEVGSAATAFTTVGLTNTYQSTLATILPQLLQQKGIQSGLIDQTAFNTFSTYTWNYYTEGDDSTVGDVVRGALASVGGYLLTTVNGGYTCGNWFGSAAPTALRRDRTTLPLVNKVTQELPSPPCWRLKLGADHCYRVMSKEEISDALQQQAAKTDAAAQLAQDALDQANAAIADAATVTALITAISDDGVLDGDEKAMLKQRVQVEAGDKTGLNSQAVAIGATTENTAFNTAYTNLTNYLNALSPSYLDTSQNTAIVRTDFDTYWTTYENAKVALTSRIAGIAATTAEHTGVSGRPTRDLILDDFDYHNETQFAKRWTNISGAGVRTFDLRDRQSKGGKYLNVAGTATNLVTNGTFATATTGWTAVGSTLSISSARLRVTRTLGSSAPGYAYQAITTVVGKTYVAIYSSFDGTATAHFQINTAADGSGTSVVDDVTDGASQSATFTAAATTYYIRLLADNASSTRTADFDDISVQENVDSQNWLVWADDLIPFDPNAFYEVEFSVRRNYGAGVLYLGLEGIDYDKTTLVNVTGANDHGAQHYIAASGVAPPLGTWTTYTGYVSGRAATGSSTVGTLAAPSKMQTNVTYIRPLAVMNYPSTLGSTDLSYVRLRKVPDMDQTADGSIYARLKALQLTSGLHDLTVAGSGLQIADQRMLPPVKAMNLGFKYGGTVTIAVTSTTATISISASTFIIGNITISYNALSASVSGTAGTTVTRYFYVDDTGFGGGTPTGGLKTTTDPKVIYQSDNRVYMGTGTWTYPASGTTTTTSTSNPDTVGVGGGGCVHADSWIETKNRGWVQARDVVVGDLLRVLNKTGSGTEFAPVLQNRTLPENGFRITSESGFTVRCSDSTPLTLKDGGYLPVWKLDGQELPVFHKGKLRFEKCRSEFVGSMPVCYISLGGLVYAAGDRKGRAILTHNVFSSASKP